MGFEKSCHSLVSVTVLRTCPCGTACQLACRSLSEGQGAGYLVPGGRVPGDSASDSFRRTVVKSLRTFYLFTFHPLTVHPFTFYLLPLTSHCPPSTCLREALRQASCPLSTVYRLPAYASRFGRQAVYCLLSTVYRPLSTIYCPPSNGAITYHTSCNPIRPH
jgi:hypothetical protein